MISPNPITAQTVSLPPPVGGWNTESPIVSMPPTDAFLLENWWPDTDGVKVRPNTQTWSTGAGTTGDIVESLIPYNGEDGVNKIFAINDNGELYIPGNTAGDLGGSGSATITGLTNGRWQSTQIGSTGGHFMFMCNGADTPRTYDGTSFANSTITGPTIANLIWCHTHQNRMWFGEEDDIDVWYLPVESHTGAATKFIMTGVASKGGYMMAMGSWSRDTGQGMDDLGIFITSEGQAIVYAGTDPASATTWSLVGVFDVGRPLGRRCLLSYNGDLLILTDEGLVSLRSVMTEGIPATNTNALWTSKVQTGFKELTSDTRDLFGWQVILHPRRRMIIINCPLKGGTTFVQIAINTITGAATKFTGLNAPVWGVRGVTTYTTFDTQQTFFGLNNAKVVQFDRQTDSAIIGDDSVDIACRAITALVYPNGDNISNKTYLRAGVSFDIAGDYYDPFSAGTIAGEFTPVITLWPDNQRGTPTTTTTTLTQDVATLYSGWAGAAGRGRGFALDISLDTKIGNSPTWFESRVMYKSGGIK